MEGKFNLIYPYLILQIYCLHYIPWLNAVFKGDARKYRHRHKGI